MKKGFVFVAAVLMCIVLTGALFLPQGREKERAAPAAAAAVREA